MLQFVKGSKYSNPNTKHTVHVCQSRKSNVKCNWEVQKDSLAIDRKIQMFDKIIKPMILFGFEM